MKKNKHLLKLAETTDKEVGWGVDYTYTQLLNLKNALLKGNYYTCVVKASASGMSRIIKIGYIKNNTFHEVRHNGILDLAGCDKNGRIGGCGMDMLFAAQYNLFTALCPKHRYQDSMRSYKMI